jgi:hypothetical protein
MLDDDVDLFGLAEHAREGGRYGRVRQWVGGCILSACAAISCTYGEPLKAPGAGGPAWIRVESEHFIVVSDLDRAEAESIARELEDGLDAIAQIAFEQPRTAIDPAMVVIFRDTNELHRFLPPLLGGAFATHALSGDPESPRFVIAQGKLTEETRSNFFHELTHDLFDLNFGVAPTWLAEGWAEYYGSVRIEGDQIRVGAPLQHITFTDGPSFQRFRNASGVVYIAIPVGRVPSATDLIHMTKEALYAGDTAEQPSDESALRSLTNYVGSWALLHMLLDGPEPYQKRFQAFADLARSGKSVESAFAQAFADVPPRRFDADFRAYLGTKQIGVWRMPYVRPTRALAPKERYLNDAEVHLLWAQLTPWRGPRAALAERELNAAEEAAPNWPDATYYRGLFSYVQRDFGAAETRIQAALKSSPDDPRFLFGLLSLRYAQKREGAKNDDRILDVALRLARSARTAVEFNDAAEALRSFSRSAEALPLAERAVALAPLEPYALDTLANVLFDLGRVRDAVEVQTRAVSFMNEQTAARGELEQHLARYKKAAAALQ